LATPVPRFLLVLGLAFALLAGGFTALTSFAVSAVKNDLDIPELRRQLDAAERLALADDHPAPDLGGPASPEPSATEPAAHVTVTPDPVPFKQIWSATFKRIDLYEGIAQTQARTSFRVVAVASVCGFGMLLLCSLLVMVRGGPVAEMTALSVIGVSAAGLAGFIAKTFGATYKTAVSQLFTYFYQPWELSRQLNAERVVNTLPESDRPAAAARLAQHISRRRQPAVTNDTHDVGAGS
jgi:hypothetical protein